jgi:hypothetical protein
MVTFLADATSLDPKDVIAPIGAVCGAAIAAFVAWFNARQTATERLQTLIAIYKEWPTTAVTGQEHIAGLIRGQVGEMWHRYPHLRAAHATDADRAEIDAAANRHLHMDWVLFGASLVAIAVGVCLLVLIHEDQDGWLILASLAVGFAAFVAVSRLLRIVRHDL